MALAGRRDHPQETIHSPVLSARPEESFKRSNPWVVVDLIDGNAAETGFADDRVRDHHLIE